MKIIELNSISEELFCAKMLNCCSSKSFVKKLCQLRPFQDEKELVSQAYLVWNTLVKTDFLEAFSHHPRIGEKVAQGLGSRWAKNEQSGVSQASEQVIKELIEYNEKYEKKFQHVFLICATGKSAQEMLDALKIRILNSPEQELKNACIEQGKITELRIKKLLSED